jgi:MoxR-like ATPase
MLYLRTLEAADTAVPGAVADVFGPDFIVRRPLLEAIDGDHQRPPVLLIDEIDRADDEFEAFLLELLSDFQVTIPEVGTIRARERPIVVLTSNRTRELHDALRRRCLFHWIGYPTIQREVEIVRAQLPDAPATLAAEVAQFVADLRTAGLEKTPGVAETLDWVQALCSLGEDALTPETAATTLGAVLKSHEDLERVHEDGIEQRVQRAKAAAPATDG